MILSSLLIHTCDIREKTKTQNATTGEMITSWTDAYTSVKCRLDSAKHREYEDQEIIYSRATHILYINPISGYTITTGKNEIIITDNFNTRTFEVLGVDNAAGQGNHLQIYLKILKW